MIRPVARSVGSNLAKVATSDTAKSIAKTLGEQALDSTMNMTKDLLNGNDMKHAVDREVAQFRKRGGDIIDDVQSKRGRKTSDRPIRRVPKKRLTLKLMRKYDGGDRYQ